MGMITYIEDTKELGSNNWAVTGDLTKTGAAMLSDDMHLSFAVPIIWYRAQLNYPVEWPDATNNRRFAAGCPCNCGWYK